MSGDPARRPSSDRVRVEVNFDQTVWIECASCLGDGWHYAGRSDRPDTNRTSRKERCTSCDGSGATETLQAYCGPHTRIVKTPAAVGSEINSEGVK